MTPKQLRAIDVQIAEKIMGWHCGNAPKGDLLYWWKDPDKPPVMPLAAWLPTIHPVSSKALRDKLAERFSVLALTRINGLFNFAMGSDPRDAIHVVRQIATEELAVALCACKPYGIEVPA